MHSSKQEKLLPDFLIIGAMRAGTTSLYDMLSNIQGITVAHMKETDFYIAEQNFDYGYDWYKSQFSDVENNLCGDISPNYTKRDIFKGVPERVYEANSHVRIIFIARDPLDRALSHYKFSYHYGVDMPAPSDFMQSDKGQHILATSRYAWQLEPWVKIFGRDAIHIIDFSALCDSPQDVLRGLCDFVGLDDCPEHFDLEQKNSAEDLGRMPLWYLKLRGTAFGTKMRAMMPRSLADKIKACLPGRIKPSEITPAFSSDVIDAMKSSLRADANLFREISGMAFEDWKV